VGCKPDAAVKVIQASDYDQTCAVDTDCVGIVEGSTCNACTLNCSNAAIRKSAMAQYNADTTNILTAAFELCPSSCGGPEAACCRGGLCHWGYPTCPYPTGILETDAGAGAADAGESGDGDAGDASVE
jgi:hypothetical protein